MMRILFGRTDMSWSDPGRPSHDEQSMTDLMGDSDSAIKEGGGARVDTAAR
jgi:hypothetical protein